MATLEPGRSRGRPAALADASPFGRQVITFVEEQNMTLSGLANQIGTSPANMSDLLKKPTARRRDIIRKLIALFPPAAQVELGRLLPEGILSPGDLDAAPTQPQVLAGDPSSARPDSSLLRRSGALPQEIANIHELPLALSRLMQRYPSLAAALPDEGMEQALQLANRLVTAYGQISLRHLVTVVNTVVAARARQDGWFARMWELDELPCRLSAPLLSSAAGDAIAAVAALAREAAQDDSADDVTCELPVCAFRDQGRNLLLTVPPSDMIPGDQQVVGRLQFHPWRKSRQRPHSIDYDEAAQWLRTRAEGERILLVVREWPVKIWFALVATDQTETKVQNLLQISQPGDVEPGYLETDLLRLCQRFQAIFTGVYAQSLSIRNFQIWNPHSPQLEAFQQIAAASGCGAYTTNVTSGRNAEKKISIPGGEEFMSLLG